MGRPVVLLVLAALLVGVAAEGGASRPSTTKKPSLPQADEPAATRPHAAQQQLSRLALAKTVIGAANAVQPYLRNPLRLPPHLGAFVGLLLLSVYQLIKTAMSVFTFIAKPADFAFNLCLASGLHYAALIALRGWPAQMRAMGAPDRQGYSMGSVTSFVAALYVSLKGERLGSAIFGALHLICFGLDLGSRLPGGRAVFGVLLGAYVRFFRWLLSMVGIEIRLPVWAVDTQAKKATKLKASTSSFSSFASWLGLSGVDGEASPDPAAIAAARVAALSKLQHATAVLLTPGTSFELLPPSIVLGARALSESELMKLKDAIAAARGTPGVDVIGRSAAWNPKWLGLGEDAGTSKRRSPLWFVPHSNASSNGFDGWERSSATHVSHAAAAAIAASNATAARAKAQAAAHAGTQGASSDTAKTETAQKSNISSSASTNASRRSPGSNGPAVVWPRTGWIIRKETVEVGPILNDLNRYLAFLARAADAGARSAQMAALKTVQEPARKAELRDKSNRAPAHAVGDNGDALDELDSYLDELDCDDMALEKSESSVDDLTSNINELDRLDPHVEDRSKATTQVSSSVSSDGGADPNASKNTASTVSLATGESTAGVLLFVLQAREPPKPKASERALGWWHSTGSGVGGLLASTGSWLNSTVEKMMPDETFSEGAGVDSPGREKGTRADDDRHAIEDRALSAATTGGANFFTPMGEEDLEELKAAASAISQWGGSVTRRTTQTFTRAGDGLRGAFTSSFSYFGLGAQPPAPPPRRRGAKKRCASKLSKSKLAKSKLSKSKKSKSSLDDSRSRAKSRKAATKARPKGAKRAARPTTYLARASQPKPPVRSSQLLAYAMAREHQMQLALQVAAALGAADPQAPEQLAELARELSLAFAQKGVTSRSGTTVEITTTTITATPGGNFGGVQGGAGLGEPKSLIEPLGPAAPLSDHRALVPYNPAAAASSQRSSHYADFLVSELRRLVDEGVDTGATAAAAVAAARRAERLNAARRREETRRRRQRAAHQRARKAVGSSDAVLLSRLDGVVSKAIDKGKADEITSVQQKRSNALAREKEKSTPTRSTKRIGPNKGKKRVKHQEKENQEHASTPGSLFSRLGLSGLERSSTMALQSASEGLVAAASSAGGLFSGLWDSGSKSEMVTIDELDDLADAEISSSTGAEEGSAMVSTTAAEMPMLQNEVRDYGTSARSLLKKSGKKKKSSVARQTSSKQGPLTAVKTPKKGARPEMTARGQRQTSAKPARSKKQKSSMASSISRTKKKGMVRRKSRGVRNVTLATSGNSNATVLGASANMIALDDDDVARGAPAIGSGTTAPAEELRGVLEGPSMNDIIVALTTGGMREGSVVASTGSDDPVVNDGALASIDLQRSNVNATTRDTQDADMEVVGLSQVADFLDSCATASTAEALASGGTQNALALELSNARASEGDVGGSDRLARSTSGGQKRKQAGRSAAKGSGKTSASLVKRRTTATSTSKKSFRVVSRGIELSAPDGLGSSMEVPILKQPLRASVKASPRPPARRKRRSTSIRQMPPRTGHIQSGEKALGTVEANNERYVMTSQIPPESGSEGGSYGGNLAGDGEDAVELPQFPASIKPHPPRFPPPSRPSRIAGVDEASSNSSLIDDYLSSAEVEVLDDGHG